MKLVILTSDIIDGVIIVQEILRAGKDVKGIVYEKKPWTIKSFLKRVLFLMKGIISHLGYKGLAAQGKGIIVRGVDNVNSGITASLLEETRPDLIIVAGTRKINKDIFGNSRFGAINMHSGILPYYRGADSEFWALCNNEPEKIGVSIHFLDEALDTGDVILQASQDVTESDDHKSLRMKNIMLGAQKMVEAIDMIESGESSRIKQDESLAKTYLSATREDIKNYYSSKTKTRV